MYDKDYSLGFWKIFISYLRLVGLGQQNSLNSLKNLSRRIFCVMVCVFQGTFTKEKGLKCMQSAFQSSYSDRAPVVHMSIYISLSL